MPSPARTPEERAGAEVVVELPHDAVAPMQAREAVRAAFAQWGLDVLIDDAELAVSELVTNAFRHGLPPVVLTLRQTEGRVQIDVSDTRPSTTTVGWALASEDHDESGRGRGIIESVSDRSGTDEADGRGKSSYASWNVDPHTPSGL